MNRHFTVALVAVAAGVLATSARVSAQEFTLQIALPVAGNSQSTKNSLFVVRPGGCADPANARITATAEGVVNGARQSLPLTVSALPTPGVHTVPKDWAEKGGFWVVSLVGTCAGKTAGAIVPVERNATNATFRRESIKQLPHRATTEEIDASLKTLMTGGRR